MVPFTIQDIRNKTDIKLKLYLKTIKYLIKTYGTPLPQLPKKIFLKMHHSLIRQMRIFKFSVLHVVSPSNFLILLKQCINTRSTSAIGVTA